MLEFCLKIVIVLVLFVILFSIAHNITPQETIQRIVDAAKELWVFICSFFDSNDPMNPYL